MSLRVCGVVLACLALFACGDDGEEGETQTSPTTSAPTSSTESGGVQTSASSGPLTTGDDMTSTAAMTGTGDTSGSGSGSTSGAVGPLDQARYTDEVHSVIVQVCAACHTPEDAFPFTVWPDDPMLTYETALNFVSEPAETSALLTVPVGGNFFDQGGVNDPRYQTILAWISGEPSPM